MNTRSVQPRDVLLWNRALGHVHTLKPFLQRSFRPSRRPETTRFVTELHDTEVGVVDVTGQLLLRDPGHIVVVIHGLGGSVMSGYMTDALWAADQLGLSMLLLNCRGADRTNSDFYHSGLIADLEASLNSAVLSGFDHVYLLGYSIGGHVALRYACARPDPRLQRVAAVCSPLQLGFAADDFDRPKFNVYRGHVMDGLKEIYTACYQRRPRGILPEQARAIHRIRHWDEQIVAPRFGFESAEHYYQSESVGPRLVDLGVECLFVGASFDPMVRRERVEPFLKASQVRCVWDERAGHLGFRPDFDLGLPGALGLEAQVLSWLVRGA